MKSKNTLLIIMGFWCVAALPAAGCTWPILPAQTPAGTQPLDTKIDRLNPAAVCCGEVGGTPNTVKNIDGSEYGMCAFPNTTQCEEWALFRGEGCTPFAAPDATPAQ